MAQQELRQPDRRRLLLVGNSGIQRIIHDSGAGFHSHYYENLMELMYDQPTDEYDVAVVSYKDDDFESVEAARYLATFFRKMPIFIVSNGVRGEKDFERFEKKSEFNFVPDCRAAINILSDYRDPPGAKQYQQFH